jgi:hypothetical protein
MNQHRDFMLLVHRYADGELPADEMRELNEQLRSNADARRVFMELLNLDAGLAAITIDGSPQQIEECDHAADSVTVIADSAGTRGQRSFSFWALGLAACLAVLLAVMLRPQAATQQFATVERVAGVEELSDQAVLGTDSYEIQVGTLELVTSRGVRVVIEAPAAFRFESSQRLHLTRGRLTADVPPEAKGFTVVTPNGEAVDLGTKFGVDVPIQGQSEIHVFQGEVIAQSTGGGKPQCLHDGEAYQLQSGAGAARDLRSAAFIRADEVASLHAALAAGQRSVSDTALSKLRLDPALIAFLDFESDVAPEGNYRMVQGRWPGSRAPEFVNVGEHMAIEVGADRDWPQMTLAAWVRIDRLDAPYQSLLHTDGWNIENMGQVHWMINRNTTMRLALYGNTLAPGSDELDGYPDSRTSVLPEQGRWVHLAVVYDSSRRTVRFYLNGAFDKESRQEIAHPARLGAAQIGNWEERDRKLSGRIDELLILGRAMSDTEINVLFEAGNPYR